MKVFYGFCEAPPGLMFYSLTNDADFLADFLGKFLFFFPLSIGRLGEKKAKTLADKGQRAP